MSGRHATLLVDDIITGWLRVRVHQEEPVPSGSGVSLRLFTCVGQYRVYAALEEGEELRRFTGRGRAVCGVAAVHGLGWRETVKACWTVVPVVVGDEHVLGARIEGVELDRRFDGANYVRQDGVQELASGAIDHDPDIRFDARVRGMSLWDRTLVVDVMSTKLVVVLLPSELRAVVDSHTLQGMTARAQVGDQAIDHRDRRLCSHVVAIPCPKEGTVVV